MTVISMDFETRSAVDLRKTGVYPYAEHPTTDVWCLAWAIDDGPVELWTPGLEGDGGYLEGVLLQGIEDGWEFRAWNAMFERIIWREIMVKRYHFPEVPLEYWVDTAAEAAALSLPRSLFRAGQVLGVDVEKDMDGRRLMLQMAKPRRPRKDEDPDALLWWDDRARRRRLYEYCRTDVEVERMIAERLRPLSPSEREVYLLDQRINDRGVNVDGDLIEAAKDIVDTGLLRAGDDLYAVTSGAVSAVTQVANLKRWLEHRGHGVESLSKAVLRDLLEGDIELPADVRKALQIRADTAKSSTSKLGALEHYTAADGRIHGLYLFHGAGTGRWAGKGPQQQNLPRPTVRDPRRFVDRVLERDFDGIEEQEPALAVVSSLLRSMLTASPGCELFGVDYSQIEARVLAWLAGQDDLVALFAAGGKVYEEMASFIYGIPVEEIGKDSYERQIGKNSVLGAGFQMGADRFAGQVWEQTGITLERGLRWACAACRVRYRPPGEDDPEVMLCPHCGDPLERQQVKDDEAARAINGYRTRFDRVPNLWRELNDAAFSAVLEPGSIQRVKPGGGEIVYTVRGQFLWCQLPSGRFLAYALPAIRPVPVPWDDTGETKRPAVTYATVDSRTGRWGRRAGYGGLWTENVVQAIARDLLAGAMARAEERGYCIVMHTHDELVADVPKGHGTLEELESIMLTLPPWAEGLPVAAEGWIDRRYRK